MLVVNTRFRMRIVGPFASVALARRAIHLDRERANRRLSDYSVKPLWPEDAFIALESS